MIGFQLNLAYWNQHSVNKSIVNHMLTYLREGHSIIADAQRILQIVVVARYELTRAYDVYFSKADESFHLVRIRWVHYGLDLSQELPSGFVPELEFIHKPIALADVETVYEALQKDIPIWFAPTIERRFRHADEILYELTLGGHVLGVRYTWGIEAPSGWQPIYDATVHAMERFDVLVSRSSR